jgi:hypothetical protein
VTPLQAVLRYRDLLQVENLFLRTKAIMRTRPIFHSSDAAIRGHVFCSFLALAMQTTKARLTVWGHYREPAHWFASSRNSLSALSSFSAANVRRKSLPQLPTQGNLRMLNISPDDVHRFPAARLHNREQPDAVGH